jgi:hypothetical protein
MVYVAGAVRVRVATPLEQVFDAVPPEAERSFEAELMTKDPPVPADMVTTTLSSFTEMTSATEPALTVRVVAGVVSVKKVSALYERGAARTGSAIPKKITGTRSARDRIECKFMIRKG